MIKGNTNIVLFDAECRLCLKTVSFLKRKDGDDKFRFIALQSSNGVYLLSKYGMSIDYRKSIIYIRNGNLFKESAAVIFILRDLGGAWKIFLVFLVIPNFIRNGIYKLIAKIRYKIWGKVDYCPVCVE
jgi:predicted DCC family thiol-disulfide oxidoreductase YuxK